MVRLGYNMTSSHCARRLFLARSTNTLPGAWNSVWGSLTIPELKDILELLDLLKLAREHDQLQSIQPYLFHKIYNLFYLKLTTEPDPRLPQALRLTMAADFTIIRKAPVGLAYQWLHNLPFPRRVSAGHTCAPAGTKICFDVFFDCELAHGLDEWDPRTKQLCNNCTTQAKTAYLEGRKRY